MKRHLVTIKQDTTCTENNPGFDLASEKSRERGRASAEENIGIVFGASIIILFFIF